MATKTRTKLLIAVAAAAALTLAVFGAHQSRAASGGTIVQFGTDPTLTSTATSVTSSQAFPDGATTAQCFIKVTSKSGAQTPTLGNCTNISVTVTCSSSQFDNSSGAPDKGANMKLNGTNSWTGAYDVGAGNCPGTPAAVAGVNPSLQATVAGLPSGAKVIVFVNNDSQATRSTCAVYSDTGGAATPMCFTNTSAGNDGTYYEATSAASSGTITMGSCPTGQTGNCAANATLGGVFVELAAAGGTSTPTVAGTPAPTATATVVLAAHTLSVSRSHGVTRLRWYSTANVRGYNVFDGTKRVNHKLVTSHTHWYTFKTARVLHHPWVAAVH